ncbi:MAG: ABC transporter ATP-binding protein [Thermodesulfobacteriota bacterium]
MEAILNKFKTASRVDKAIRFVWEASRKWTLASILIVVCLGALPLATLYLMKLIVDGVADSVAAPDKMAAFWQIAFLIGIAGGIAIFQAVCQLAENLVKEAQSLAVSDHMYNIIHEKSISVDLEYYENPKYFDTLHRAQHEGPYRPLQIVTGLMRLGQNSLSLVAVVGLLVSFHWVVALILLIAAIPGIFVKVKFSGRVFHWQRERTPTERKAGYFNWMLVGYGHAKEIRLFRLGTLFVERFNELKSLLRREKLDINRKRSIADFFAQAFATFAVFGSFAMIAYRTVQGSITLGDMVMYFQAFQRGLSFLQGTLGGMADLYENNLFLSNLFEFLDLKPKVKDTIQPAPFPESFKKGIQFDRVDFIYPATSKKVIDDVSLSIAPGEVVAFVGDNGSGKTTLAKLLCRLYDPIKGKISIDDIDIRKFSLDSLRRRISVIFQDYVHYHLTVRENIWFGNVELSNRDSRIEKAANSAGAMDLIERLPKGLDTILGKWFEDGEELSIGEWQKIALARAFMGESRIIVLDEPTSNLDVKTEYAVFERFKRLLDGRSAILISHRFSTVRMADRIILMENGRIKEAGSHEELMQLKGKYAEMFEKQARFYK